MTRFSLKYLICAGTPSQQVLLQSAADVLINPHLLPLFSTSCPVNEKPSTTPSWSMQSHLYHQRVLKKELYAPMPLRNPSHTPHSPSYRPVCSSHPPSPHPGYRSGLDIRTVGHGTRNIARGRTGRGQHSPRHGIWGRRSLDLWRWDLKTGRRKRRARPSRG